MIQLTKSEYTKVVNKLGVVTNTHTEDVTLEVSAGEEAELPKQVTGYIVMVQLQLLMFLGVKKARKY